MKTKIDCMERALLLPRRTSITSLYRIENLIFDDGRRSTVCVRECFPSYVKSDEKPAAIYTMSFQRRGQIVLSDVDNFFEARTTAVLKRIAHGTHYVRYCGSGYEPAGNHVHYSVAIRTDLTADLRRRGIIATVELVRTTRRPGLLSKLFSVRASDWNEYDIYNDDGEGDPTTGFIEITDDEGGGEQ